jgi:microcystin degradation protein MlrC
MRIAVGGIYHESNTFFAQPMTMERFAEGQFHRGEDIPKHWAGTCSEMAGFLEGARNFGFDVVPTLMAWGMPSGALTDETFEALAGELIERLKAAGPLDGVLLSLHGAMVANSYPDADGEVLRRARTAMGPKLPLVVTLDFHANLTDQMVEHADVLIGYKTYPHIDQTERGLEAANVLYQMLTQGLQPHMVLSRRPLLAHILRQATDRAPMSEIMAAAAEAQHEPGIVSVTVAAGFPYTDVPHAGFAVLAVGETRSAACAVAERVAALGWQRRAEFARELPDAANAVAAAIAAPDGLTVLVDVGDNVGAGTPGDGTVLLRELLKQGARDALVLLCDQYAVAACNAIGVRRKTGLKVGAKLDRYHGEPLEIEATVRSLSDGIYRNVGDMRHGVLEDQGRTAVVDTGGVLVVLTERRQPMWNLQQLRSLGIEPSRLRIIVVKAAIAYRAAYLPIAARVIEVDTPGLSAADVRRFNYTRLERPMYPLDPL